MNRDGPPLEGDAVLPPMESDRSKPKGNGETDPKARSRGRTARRFGVLNAFVDVTLRQVDSTAAVVWLILFRDAKPNGLVRTSQADLARRAGLSVSTIYRAVCRLRGLGLLTVVRKGRLNVGASTYRLRWAVKDEPTAKRK